MPALSRRLAATSAAALTLLAILLGARDDEPPAGSVHRDGFEDSGLAWRQEETRDTTFLLREHDRSDRSAHEGRFSERFVFESGPGSEIFYSYGLPKAPLVEGLKATLYVRSNRPGVQLFGIVELPADKDPDTGRIGQIMVPGTSLAQADRWQRLELSDLVANVGRQARVLRAGTERQVNLDGAYLKRLVVNLYGGPGETEVFLDELTVSPVAAADLPPALGEARPEVPGDPAPEAGPGSKDAVKLVGSYLTRDGLPWFPKLVSAPGADPEQLRRAGFDVLAIGADADPDLASKAVDLGFLLMPSLAGARGLDPASAAAFAAGYPLRSSVAMWGLGEGLGLSNDLDERRAELERVRRTIRSIHDLNEGGSRLTAGDVAGMFPQYALFGENLDLMGIDIADLGTIREPIDTCRYLGQRRALTATANPNGLFLAWVPTSPPAAIRRAVWGMDVPPDWGWPQVQTEQMRIYAFAALSSGYRGIGFRGDADLGGPGGLPRLYEAALLNGEISVLEPLLARSGDPILTWPAFPPDPKPKLEYNASGTAGGLSTLGRGNTQEYNKKYEETRPLENVRVTSIESEDRRTKLLIVGEFGGGSQWQPSKLAMHDMNLVVQGPESAQAFEITLGGVNVLKSWRDTGGRRIVLPTFDTTALVLLTTDFALVQQVEARVNAIRPKAVDLAIQQAEMKIREVEPVHRLLLARGRPVRNAEEMLAEAKVSLQSAVAARESHNFPLAWTEARTVSQILRTVMREHWQVALDDFRKSVGAINRTDGPPPITDSRGKPRRPAQLLSPVACPPLLCWQTLPQYDAWHDAILGGKGPFGENLLPTGSFDGDPETMREEGWVNESYATEGFKAAISIDRKEGWGRAKSALKFEVGPAETVDREKYRKPDGKLDDKAYEKDLFATIDNLPPFLDHPAAAVRTPPIPVEAMDFVRIRVLVKMPRQIPEGTGGLIVRDSIGGEALQFRTTEVISEWKEVVLYRRAPAAGELTVLLGFAGSGRAYFDDLRIDVIGRSSPRSPRAPETQPIARRPSPSLPTSSSDQPSTRPRR